MMLLCHYAEQRRIMDNRLAIFIFFLLCSFFLLLFFSVFGEFQAPPIGLEYELQCGESYTMDANILEMMPRKMGEKQIVLVGVDMA